MFGNCKSATRQQFSSMFKETVNLRNIQTNQDKHSAISTIIPLKERMQLYLQARNKIFSQHQLAGMRLVSRKILKTRGRSRQRRTKRKEVAAAVVRNDPRPFAEIKIGGERVRVMLETGASVILLGCRELLQSINVPIFFRGTIRRRRGSLHNRPRAYTCRIFEENRRITFYMCPYLEQKAYLGVDFLETLRAGARAVLPCESKMS